MSQPDLFWQWNPSPGALIPVKRAGPFTMTRANGAEHFLLWYYDRLLATGSIETVETALSVQQSSRQLQHVEPQAASEQRQDHRHGLHVAQ